MIFSFTNTIQWKINFSDIFGAKKPVDGNFWKIVSHLVVTTGHGMVDFQSRPDPNLEHCLYSKGDK